MISYLAGKIIFKGDKFIILEVGGVGYKVFLSKKTFLNLPEKGENLKIFCFQDIKENSIDLYGFLTYEELEFFELLNDIRGIGPKVALEISSLGPLEKIKEKILKQEEDIFSGIPGIGAKKAAAIILELTGKIKTLEKKEYKGVSDETELALIKLGFTKEQAKTALKQVPSNIESVEEKIKIALRNLRKT